MKIKVYFKPQTDLEPKIFEGEVQLLQQCIRISRKIESEQKSILITLDEKEDATYIPMSSIAYFETLNSDKGSVQEV